MKPRKLEDLSGKSRIQAYKMLRDDEPISPPSLEDKLADAINDIKNLISSSKHDTIIKDTSVAIIGVLMEIKDSIQGLKRKEWSEINIERQGDLGSGSYIIKRRK